jgi:putative transposase
MSYHTRTSILFHWVFSTKNRLPSIPIEIKPRLWSYIGGIARTNNMKALAVGGMRDHLHVLLSLPPTITIAKAIQLIKAGSSKWMHEQGAKRFEWQVGYGAFTIGISAASQFRKKVVVKAGYIIPACPCLPSCKSRSTRF